MESEEYVMISYKDWDHMLVANQLTDENIKEIFGLVYIPYPNSFLGTSDHLYTHYKFLITDNNLWMLAKIKYGI
jgi:hypothetical protein